jgi:hypothetical protein
MTRRLLLARLLSSLGVEVVVIVVVVVSVVVFVVRYTFLLLLHYIENNTRLSYLTSEIYKTIETLYYKGGGGVNILLCKI